MVGLHADSKLKLKTMTVLILHTETLPVFVQKSQ